MPRPTLGHSVIGIDPSSKAIAWCRIDEDDITVGKIKLGKTADKFAPWKLRIAERELRRVFPNANRTCHLFLEAPIVGGGSATPARVASTLPQAYVSGVIQAHFARQGATVDLVHLATWKAQVIGNGGASKAEVARVIRLRWPGIAEQAGGDQDILDASGIALYGAGIRRK